MSDVLDEGGVSWWGRGWRGGGVEGWNGGEGRGETGRDREI